MAARARCWPDVTKALIGSMGTEINRRKAAQGRANYGITCLTPFATWTSECPAGTWGTSTRSSKQKYAWPMNRPHTVSGASLPVERLVHGGCVRGAHWRSGRPWRKLVNRSKRAGSKKRVLAQTTADHPGAILTA